VSQVQFCRLANLPDLAQENGAVASTLSAWVGAAVHQYGFDGLRVDTVREVPPDFWKQYAASAGMLCMCLY